MSIKGPNAEPGHASDVSSRGETWCARRPRGRGARRVRRSRASMRLLQRSPETRGAVFSLLLESFRAADDLHQLFGRWRLASTVVASVSEPSFFAFVFAESIAVMRAPSRCMDSRSARKMEVRRNRRVGRGAHLVGLRDVVDPWLRRSAARRRSQAGAAKAVRRRTLVIALLNSCRRGRSSRRRLHELRNDRARDEPRFRDVEAVPDGREIVATGALRLRR